MAKKLTLIGDVHGKYAQYKRLIKDHPDTIQVGDMGVGFFKWPHGDVCPNPPHDVMVENNARFIRGNHDNPKACTQQSQWIPDGTVENGIMFIGGALSIDRARRTECFNWWPDEELSYAALNAMVDKYIQTKPRVMVTHDCPEEVGNYILNCLPNLSGGAWKKLEGRTPHAFQSMFSAHSPELWVFGHWHYSFDHVFRNTRFVCLNELELKEFEI